MNENMRHEYRCRSSIQGPFIPVVIKIGFDFRRRKVNNFKSKFMRRRMESKLIQLFTFGKLSNLPTAQESFANRNVTDDKKLDGGRYGRRVPRALDYSESNPSSQFSVPADGDYCVSARDLYGNARSDPRSIYRLVVKPSEPGFRLVAWTQRFRKENNNNRVDRASLALHPGESREILVDVIREGGFNGPLTLNATGLPEGVSCSEMVVATGQTEAAIVLTAASDAVPSHGVIQILGNATIGGKSQTRYAMDGLLTSDVGNVGGERPSRRALGEVFVSVKGTSEKTPAAVRIGKLRKWQSSVGAVLKIPVEYKRNSEIKGELKMNSIELPGEIKPKELVLKPDTSVSLEVPLNNPKIKPGEYSFFMTGQVAANFTRNQAAIDALEKQLTSFDLTLKKIQANEQTATAKREELNQRLAAINVNNDADSHEAAKARQTVQAAAADAEKALQEASEKKQRAEQFRKSLEERLNNSKKQNGPRDAQIVVTSTPVTIEVLESPLAIAVSDVSVTLPQEGDSNENSTPVEVQGKLKIERRFGFADAVDVAVTIPEGHPPITLSSITKDQTNAAISSSVPLGTKPGRYEYPVTLKLKFGGVDIQDLATVGLVVSKPVEETAPESTAEKSPVTSPAK